jgi:5'-nucleotidase
MIRLSVSLALSVALAAVSPASAQTAPAAGAQPSAAHAGAAAVLGAHARPAPKRKLAPVEIGIAAFNDFHGALVNPHQAVLVPNGSGKTGPKASSSFRRAARHGLPARWTACGANIPTMSPCRQAI